MLSLHFSLLLSLLLLNISSPFLLPPSTTLGRPTSGTTTSAFGIMDIFKGAFNNEAYQAPPEGVKASARHILVPTKALANDLKKQIEREEITFVQAASKFSTCSSKSQGGSLGSFPPGRMVPQFDDVVFAEKTVVGEVLGPVATEFGFHLIKVEKRSGV